MKRRTFIQSSLMGAVAIPFPDILSPQRTVSDLDVKITKIVCFRVPYTRPRVVGGNSKYKMAGGTRHDWMIALFAENGMIGLGSGPRYGKPAPTDFPIGKSVGELLNSYLQETADKIGTTAVWDLAGKIQEKPVYELLGGKRKPEGVRVYDGGIYIEELVNRDKGSPYRREQAPYGNRPNWKDVFKEAMDISQQHGHNFVKVKIGRGSIHLSREAGNIQDATVLQFLREYGGKDLSIGVDANNGYRLEDTLWLLQEYGDLNLAFIEEMFHEDIEKYREIKSFIRKNKLSTYIADGENWKSPTQAGVPELIESGVLDVLQGDMRMFQIEGILKEAELGQKVGSLVAPHNWGSEFAFYVMIHMGNVLPNFYAAENDIGKIDSPIYQGEAYTIKEGRCYAPQDPGFGLTLKPEMLNNAEIIYQYG